MMEPSDDSRSDAAVIAALAARHKLRPVGAIEINDLGLDFRAAFMTDERGEAWVLRLPRRGDVVPRAEYEARVLQFLKGRIPVEIPDWRITTPELIAYPRLAGRTAVTIDPTTKEPTWNIAQDSPTFHESLAKTLAALHRATLAEEAAAAGVKVSTPDEVRRSFAAELDQVNREIGIGEALWRQWNAWLDDETSWPPFSTLVHGDLHVGHVLVDATSRATGILDWTEAEVSDPAIDFIFHLMGFGADGLDRLLNTYEAQGGRTWPGLRSHVAQRLAAFPIKYALFALISGEQEHLDAARAQLGVDPQ